jgi:hypothetical protein
MSTGLVQRGLEMKLRVKVDGKMRIVRRGFAWKSAYLEADDAAAREYRADFVAARRSARKPRRSRGWSHRRF